MNSESQTSSEQLQSEADAQDPHFTDVVVESEPSGADRDGALPFPVVGIGASAGGVEAYIELLSELAPDTGMAFVLVPHLSADYETHLVEILARHTSMPVSEVRADVEPEINQVYVIPRNARLTIAERKFHLHTRLPSDRLPIDHF